MSQKTIYLDYNSTTPVDRRVLDAMLPYFTEKFGNAASKTHGFGWVAEDAVKIAREQVARLINAEEGEIIFTSGATEAINLAIKGVFETYASKGNHIITVSTEHVSVIDTCRYLEKKGACVTYLQVDREGLLDLEELKKHITQQTILIVVMYGNNETGVIQPIREIGEIAHANGCLFMCDATQAMGKQRIDVQEEGIDLMCFSGHKMYAPKGIGALYVRRKNPRVRLLPQIDGGGHENGLRSGTLNVPGIVALGKACEIAEQEMWDDNIRLSKFRTLLEQAMIDLGEVHVNGSQKSRLPHVSNLFFRGIRSSALIPALPSLAFATGSACSSAKLEPSHVLRAMGLKDEEATSSVRFSLGKYTTETEVKEAIHLLEEAVRKIR